MNNRNSKYILILILSIFFGCQNEPKIDGNYYVCEDGYYSEVYIKNDSIRVSWDTNGDDLTEWQKMEIKNDTLYFMQFGHLIDSIKGKMKYVGNDRMEFHYIIGSGKYSFEGVNTLNRIDDKLNFKSIKEFWAEFKKRQNLADCQSKPKKNDG
jgi:hypothetical protein